MHAPHHNIAPSTSSVGQMGRALKMAIASAAATFIRPPIALVEAAAVKTALV